MGGAAGAICVLCLALSSMIFIISMIVVGGVYINDCPMQNYIPIYLIVAGVFSLLEMIFSIVRAQISDDVKPRVYDTLVGLFFFAWFICGNVWIYGIHGKFSDDIGSELYCNAHLYWFAFSITTIGYICVGIALLGACLYCCCCQ